MTSALSVVMPDLLNSTVRRNDGGVFYGSSGLSGLSLIDESVTKESPAFHLERVRGVKGLRVQVMDFNRLHCNEYENDSFRHGLLIAFPINLVLSIPWPLDPLNPLSNQPK